MSLEAIVCEDFTYRRLNNAVLTSVEYIGVVKLFIQNHFDVELAMQPPPLKGFANKDKLKKMGLYIPGQRNAMDAISHLVFYLNKRNELPGYWLEALK
jgi:hypothetical protein